MLSIQKIKSPVRKELEIFNKRFHESMKSKVPLLNIIVKYIIKSKGKQMRPTLVLLSAKMLGEINTSTYTAATFVELLHTASLIHDDVVDDAYERRGFLSINALWKSKAAVLMGDYLLAKGLLLAIGNQEYKLLEIVSDAVREMSEGELLQIQKSRKLNINESTYFEIISKKTAALIASCTACGAKSINSDDEIVSKMKDFGRKVGIAFQIKDDLFDYEKNSNTGKPKGNDIKEKKFTLPLIHSLNMADKSDSKEIIRCINHSNGSKNILKKVKVFVERNHGITYARDTMLHYANEAKEILNEFPRNESRKALIDLVDFTINRNN